MKKPKQVPSLPGPASNVSAAPAFLVSPGSRGPLAPMILTVPPSRGEIQRWILRGTWELASVIHFFNVFRPVLNLKRGFTIDELESALLLPNELLAEIHIMLLKAILPVNDTALNQGMWVAVLCKRLRDWWHLVAEGPLPIEPEDGVELTAYNELNPEVRATILKALCELRADQEDIRLYIVNSLKQGASVNAFRKEQMGVDLLGSTYWYENDITAGQRLYRELRTQSTDHDKIPVSSCSVPPCTNKCWEILATNVDEFQAIADKLSSSKIRLEVAISKKINNDVLPELLETQKKKERALKKQQREALLLDSHLNTGGIIGGLCDGRSRRERKPISYTYDDYDKSINEAIESFKSKNLPDDLKYQLNGGQLCEANTQGDFIEAGPKNEESDDSIESASNVKKKKYAGSSDSAGECEMHEDEHNADTMDYNDGEDFRHQRYAQEDTRGKSKKLKRKEHGIRTMEDHADCSKDEAYDVKAEVLVETAKCVEHGNPWNTLGSQAENLETLERVQGIRRSQRAMRNRTNYSKNDP